MVNILRSVYGCRDEGTRPAISTQTPDVPVGTGHLPSSGKRVVQTNILDSESAVPEPPSGFGQGNDFAKLGRRLRRRSFAAMYSDLATESRNKVIGGTTSG